MVHLVPHHSGQGAEGPALALFHGRRLADIARSFPGRSGGDTSIHPGTVWRWVRVGCLRRDGSRLRLRASRSPGGWLVRDDDLATFLKEVERERRGEKLVAAAPGSCTP